MNYRKIIVLLSFVLLLSGIVHAQTFARMGFKGGVNFAKFTGLDVHDAETKMGYIGGGFAAIELSETFFLQPEVLYSMKGAKFAYPGYDLTYILDYIEVPVLLKFVLSTYGSVNPYALFGPAAAFNINARYKFDVHEGEDEEGDLELIKSMETGLVFGLGFDIGAIVAEIRYTMGLSTIDDSEFDADLKNSKKT